MVKVGSSDKTCGLAAEAKRHAGEARPPLLLALAEAPLAPSEGGGGGEGDNGAPAGGTPTAFGAVVLDAATGRFRVASFADDGARARLRTLVAHVRPAELLYARGGPFHHQHTHTTS